MGPNGAAFLQANASSDPTALPRPVSALVPQVLKNFVVLERNVFATDGVGRPDGCASRRRREGEGATSVRSVTKPPPAEFDAIVIGAGINGLVCGTLLAQAKRRVVVVEARDRPGGVCMTGDVIDGFRVSSLAASDRPVRCQPRQGV